MRFSKDIIILFVSILLILPCVYSTENLQIDSLKKELLKNNIHDTTRINLYFQLVEKIYDDNLWPKYNELAYKLSQKIINSEQADVKKFAQKAQADYFNNKGYLYKLKGNIKKALAFYLQSLKICTGIAYKYGEASLSINISTLLAQQKQYNEALIYLKKAEKLSIELNNKHLYALVLQSIAGIYTHKMQYDSALIYLNKSIEAYTEIKNLNGLGEIYNGMGVIYTKKKEEAIAIEYHFKAKEIFLKTENIKQLSNTYYNIASLNFSMHKNADKSVIQNSLKYLDSSFYYTQKINYGESYADLYRLRSGLFEKYSELKGLSLAEKYDFLYKSLNDFKKYKLFADSILNSEIVENTARQQLQFEFDKKEAVLKEQQEKERQIANARNKQNKIIIWSVVTVLILMCVFSIFIANRYKVTRQQKSIIEHQKHLVEEKQKEILDSIHYAKRIQMALLTSEYYIEKNFKRLKK